MIQDIDNMCNKMAGELGGHVNITEWTLRLALDIVGHVLLQLDFHGLEGSSNKAAGMYDDDASSLATPLNEISSGIMAFN